MDQLSTALTLLGIGMITVFVVLLLVVLTGNLLIRIVNNLSSYEGTPPSGKDEPGVIAAITAAVEIVTQGQGRITKIEPKN